MRRLGGYFMPLELKVKTKGKETTYKRTETPMLENLLDALKVQRQEIEMFSDPNKQPTDEQNKRRLELLADFAARFWGKGLTKKDVLTGVSAIDGLNAIENAVAETLGMNLNDEDDEEDTGTDPKK